MREKLSKWWIAVVLVIPFALMICLHIGIALGNYFGININVPNVDASTWFIFCGNYLGGAMTLAGVMLTLKHERNIHQHEKELDNIEKEKERLGKAVCTINVVAPNIFFQTFNALSLSYNGYNVSEVAMLRRQIFEEMQKINTVKLETMFFTDTYAMASGCAACEKPCGIQSILPEFQKTYDKIGSSIYDVLQKIDTYIVTSQSNACYNELIKNCKTENKACQQNGQPLKHDPQIIKEYESKIIDITSQQKEIADAIIEICNYNQDEMLKLQTLARNYIFIRQKNAYKKCFQGNEINPLHKK